MGEIKSRLGWINKVSSGSRLTEAESDAKLIIDKTSEVEIIFKEKLKSINTNIMIFESTLENIQQKACEYANAQLKDRDMYRRRLMVSCRTALEKLRAIEKSSENL